MNCEELIVGGQYLVSGPFSQKCDTEGRWYVVELVDTQAHVYDASTRTYAAIDKIVLKDGREIKAPLNKFGVLVAEVHEGVPSNKQRALQLSQVWKPWNDRARDFYRKKYPNSPLLSSWVY